MILGEQSFCFLKISRKLSQENLFYLKVKTKNNQDVKKTKGMNSLSRENRENVMYECMTAEGLQCSGVGSATKCPSLPAHCHANQKLGLLGPQNICGVSQHHASKVTGGLFLMCRITTQKNEKNTASGSPEIPQRSVIYNLF